ncbi:GNAT family N-acetyltransferase [Demequina lignilytica]|uniref:GNAT family N-acetyltransferase n=1 Tax=Demequina lignilytica TaxID=3051663 RepID=A0AAW7M7D4_9MICO|nr:MULTISPECIES: GNAT family N-acetyltransferase [unclassified Demequina]MDN4482137.1 GNAT family N-acetyltransferase [Demequina sp. SYSU T0a273]MDN4486795.1 GNAT family N-acetyltransferase [Demequina sp. SYSU T00039]MDN4489479.1 GNAT family N-acetyltransferase [Demequina sp. SYSU T00068]
MAQVRQARPDDSAEIVHLGALMYKAVGARPTPSWAAESARTVRARLGTDLFGVVIDAEEGGLAACGLVNVAPRLARPGAQAERMGYIQWVSTAPQHQRRGYARAVMEALLDLTDAMGIEVVELHASPAGLHLYQDLGFFIKHDNVAMTAQRLRPRL